MEKAEWKRYLPLALLIFALTLGIVYWEGVIGFLGLLLQAVMPVIVGLIVAYLINILMGFYERHFFPRCRRPLAEKCRRPLCLTGALLTFVLVVVLMIYLVVPELVSAIGFLANQITPAVKDFLASDFARKILPPDIMDSLAALNWKEHLSTLAKHLLSGLGNAAGPILSAVAGIFSSAIALVTGLIFAVYLLLSKENLHSQWKGLCRCCLKPRWRERLDGGLSLLNRCFHNYIVGQCTEALILGGLCALGMMIFGFPYAGMIGALVGFTALIPIAGAYIGAGVGAIMMLTVSPITAILFLVFILVLQQLEGNLIFPRVVGGSIGLPAIWVLTAVSIGGGLMGIPGMVLGVPLMSAGYQMLKKWVRNREKADAPPEALQPSFSAPSSTPASPRTQSKKRKKR